MKNLKILTRLSSLNKDNLSQQLLWSCGLSLVTVGFGTLSINYQLSQANLEKQVRTRAQSITQSIEFATEGLLEVEQRHTLKRVIQNYGTLPAVEEITIVNSDGIILADSEGTNHDLSYKTRHSELMPTITEAQIKGMSTSRQMVLDHQLVLVQILPFSSKLFGNSGKRGLAIAILNLKQMKKDAGEIFMTTTLTLLVGITIIIFFMGILIRHNILNPIKALNTAVIDSKQTGIFSKPQKMPTNEILFLARTFKNVFEERQKIQTILEESEAREKRKSQELEATLIELKNAQTQLVQSAKMSSLGQLVAGLAHEINNPVNFIHANIKYLQENTDKLLELIQESQRHLSQNIEFLNLCDELEIDFIQEDLPKILGSITCGTQRIRDIVILLRKFSGLEEANFKAIDIHEGIENTLKILQH